MLAWILALVALSASASGQLLHEHLGGVPLSALGKSVEGIGDVNADGFADYAVGEGGATAAGLVRVYSGATGEALYTVFGTGSDEFGSSIDSGPDLTGDGVPDYLVGAPGDDSPLPDVGSVRLVSGSDGSVVWEYPGLAASARLGQVVAFTDDIDGDGYPEVAASDTHRSRVIVFSGSSGAVLGDISAGPGWSFGWDLAGGDIDKDGKGDVVVGSPKWQGSLAGGAIVYSGADLSGPPIITIVGGTQDDCGSSVDTADFDGDGFLDIAVGCPGADSTLPDVGAVRLFRGPFGLPLFNMLGSLNSEALGRSLDATADLDGDGTGDILTRSFGTVRAFSGASGMEIPLYGTNYTMLSDVAWAGDVSGNGLPAVLVGDSMFGGVGRALVWSSVCGEIANYGAGCPGSGGVIPVLGVSGCVTPISQLSVQLSQAIGPSVSYFLIGASSANGMLKGCPLLVGNIIPNVVIAPVTGSGAAGSGLVEFDVSLPAGTPVGIDVFLQAFVLDPGAVGGYSSSNGVRIRLE